MKHKHGDSYRDHKWGPWIDRGSPDGEWRGCTSKNCEQTEFRAKAAVILFEIHPREMGGTDLFLTREGAYRSAQRQLESWLQLSQKEAEDGEDPYPLATGLVWEDGVDGFGNEVHYATFCKDWWTTGKETGLASRQFPSNDRFVIREKKVGA